MENPVDSLVRTADRPGPEEPRGDLVRCSYCGTSVAPEASLRLAPATYCARCKPYAVQLFKEGSPLPGHAVYAGLWIRAGARMLDTLIMMSVNTLLSFPIVMFGGVPGERENVAAAAAVGCVVPILQTIAGAVYEIAFLARMQATPGKLLMGIRVATADGDRLSGARATARYFAHFISSFTMGIGFLMAAFDPEKRALHDHICSTRVVRR